MIRVHNINCNKLVGVDDKIENDAHDSTDLFGRGEAGRLARDVTTAVHCGSFQKAGNPPIAERELLHLFVVLEAQLLLRQTASGDDVGAVVRDIAFTVLAPSPVDWISAMR